MNKKLRVTLSFIFVLLFLAGCGVTNEVITSETASGVWDRIFVLPLAQFITFFYNLVGANLGIAIILATAIIRLLLMPLFAKSNKSMAAMQSIQPEQQRIQQKYANKKDPESQQKMQQEMMGLYKKHGVNPMAGCLPMLIQMPLFMAFFQAISRHPLIADAGSANFFGINLGATMSPANYVIAAIIAGLTFFSQRMMTRNNPSNQDNKTMNTTMKIMNYYFPIMMFSITIGTPFAMGLYFLTGQIMMMIQTLIFKRPGGPTF